MNIEYIISTRFPSEKANGYQVSKTIEALTLIGASVKLICPKRKNVNFKTKTASGVYNLRTEIEPRYIPIFDFLYLADLFASRLSIVKHCASLLNLMQFYLILLFTLRNTNCFIYTRDIHLVKFFCYIGSPLMKRIFVELHTLPASSTKKRKLVRVLRNVAGIVTVTETMKEDLTTYGLNQISICTCPDAVDLVKFVCDLSKQSARRKLNIASQDLINLYIGRFHTKGQEKGLSELIQAHAILFQSGLPVSLYLVGGPMTLANKYRRIAKQKGFPLELLHIFDYQDKTRIPIWMRGADILSMPHPYSIFFERYVSPLKLFEYLTARRPIIASRLSAIQEILTDRHDALLCTPGDPIDIAEKIELAIKDKKLSFKISSNAIRTVKKYTWQRRATSIYNFILERTKI